MKPKDGKVLNGALWIKGEPWVILDYTRPLNELMAETLKDHREYIERQIKRCNELEEWLEKQKIG